MYRGDIGNNGCSPLVIEGVPAMLHDFCSTALLFFPPIFVVIVAFAGALSLMAWWEWHERSGG